MQKIIYLKDKKNLIFSDISDQNFEENNYKEVKEVFKKDEKYIVVIK